MTQPRQIGVAVVGSGRIGTLRAHMAARHPSVRFLAVSDKDPERAGTLGRAVGAQLASGNNLDVIAHPEVDAVIVSTSEHEHAEPLLQAIDLGKPILVEKPLALSLDDADRVVGRRGSKGRGHPGRVLATSRSALDACQGTDPRGPAGPGPRRHGP